jgi:ribosomal protein L37AE/L43A
MVKMPRYYEWKKIDKEIFGERKIEFYDGQLNCPNCGQYMKKFPDSKTWYCDHCGNEQEYPY